MKEATVSGLVAVEGVKPEEAVAVESSMSSGQAGSAGDGEGSGREAFGRSREFFEELITTLAGPDSGRLTHAQMEEQLIALSRELMRTLHQDSLDPPPRQGPRRAPGRGRPWACGRCGSSAAAG
jgi:hypothetical protein